MATTIASRLHARRLSSVKTSSEEEEDDPPLVVVGVSVKYVIAAYSISRNEVYELLNEGIFQAKHFGRRTLICLESVNAWFRSLPDYKPGRKTTDKATQASIRKRSERPRKTKNPDQPKE
jgi:hypothetical protein